MFGDAVIASAILDRLLHHSITINIKSESFRLKEKLTAGLLKPKLETQRLHEPRGFCTKWRGGNNPFALPRQEQSRGRSFK